MIAAGHQPFERGDAAWLESVEKSFTALCAVPHTYPDDPTHHYEEWVVRHRIFHRTLVKACGSQWLLGFRGVLHEQIEQRYGHTPEHWLADGGYSKLQAIDEVAQRGTQPVMPPPRSNGPTKNS